jgi:hypothetical protein
MSFYKQNNFFLTNRSTGNSSVFKNFNKTKNFNNKSVDKLIPVQRREKLKNLLIVKFMKKYGIKQPEILLEEEITNFINGEKLTDADLRRFDKRLRELVGQHNEKEELMKNLSCNNSMRNSTAKLPDLRPSTEENKKDNMSVRSNHSVASKGSKKLNQNQNNLNLNSAIANPAERTTTLPNKVKSPNDEFDFDDLSIYSDNEKKNSTATNTFPFQIGGDNWDLIAKYNQKKFEEEKLNNKVKDKEIKKRLKDDLDVQMRNKMLRENSELQKNIEFDKVVLQHVENLNNLERERELEIKNKILMEKYSRDVQLKDEEKRKKIEIIKNRKYEKELGI